MNASRRTARTTSIVRAAVSAALLAVVASCSGSASESGSITQPPAGSDLESSSPASSPSLPASSPSSSVTPPITSVVAATDDVTTSTIDTTSPSGAATTTPPEDLPVVAPPNGWSTSSDLPPYASTPCCASPWPVETPSPPLPAPSEPLADGVYRLDVVPWGWSAARPDRLRVHVTRFVVCGEDADPGVWCESDDPDEVGEESAGEAIEFVVTLDQDVVVGFVGAACAADRTGPALQGWVGDGAAMRDLLLEVDSVFEREVRPLLWAGADASAAMRALAADSSFEPNLCIPDEVAEDQVYHVSYVSDAGPTLLYQTFTRFALGRDVAAGDAAQLVRPVSIEVRGGRALLMFEQCYQS